MLRILSFLHPPLNVGVGLGNRAAHLWHRTVGFSFFFLFLRRPADPHFFGAEGDLGNLVNHAVAPDLCDFWVLPFAFMPTYARPPHPHAPRAGDAAVVFVDVSPAPYGYAFFMPSFLGVSSRLRTLAVQRCGGGEAASWTHVLVCGTGFHEFFHEFPIFSAYTALLSGLVPYGIALN